MVTSKTIQLSWAMVDYRDLNGFLRGYSLQYSVRGNSTVKTVNLSVETTTSFIIRGLTYATGYNVRIAAVSAGGLGVYSAYVQMSTTQDSKFYIHVGTRLLVLRKPLL